MPKVLVTPFRRPVAASIIADGEPALVIPGMMSGDQATALLRKSLRKAGFDAQGWGVRVNTGIRQDYMACAEQRLVEMTEHCPATIIGWSLGGIYARVLAQRHPELVSMVVTLGSPFSGDRHANRAWRLYDAINDHTVENPPFDEDPAQKPSVPTVAIWSEHEGVVAPECARGQVSESDRRYAVSAKHFEMGSSRKTVKEILAIIADARAQLAS